MSVWKRLGDLGKGTLDWVGDVGLGVAAGPKFIWDVATSSFNDREEFNGVANIIRQASLDWTKNVARPLGGVGAAVLHTTENLIRQPLSAGLLTLQGNDFNKSWAARNEVSLGQAAVSGLGKVVGAVTPDSWTPDFADSDFDVFNKEEREAAFSNSIIGRWSSGIVDFNAQIFLDPTIVGGKLAKAYMAVDNLEDTIKGIQAALGGEVNKYSKAGQKFADNDQAFALSHAVARNTSDPAASSYFFSQAKTKDEALNVWLMQLGNRSGFDGLIAAKRPDIADPLARSIGILDNYDMRILLREEDKMRTLKTPDGQDIIPDMFRTADEIKADKEVLDAWMIHDKYAAKLLSVSSPESAIMKEGLGRLEKVQGFVAQGRAVRFHEKVVGEATQEFYQPTPFHKLYSVLSWAERERPSGMVNLNEGDSIKEVTAAVDRLKVLGVSGRGKDKIELFTNDEGLAFMERYSKASRPESRQAVANEFEEKGFHVLAKRFDVPEETAKLLFQKFVSMRAGALSELKETGFLWDASSRSMLRVGLFESHNANFLPLADFDIVYRLLKKNSGKIGKFKGDIPSLARGASFDATEFLDAANDVWKASVLLRLGYPVRNAIDSQLRIISTVGAMATLGHAVQGAKNVGYNVSQSKVGGRLVDRFHRVGKQDPIKMSNDIIKLKLTMKKDGIELGRLTNLMNKATDGSKKKSDLVSQIALGRTNMKINRETFKINQETLARLERINTGSGKRRLGKEDVVLKSMYLRPDGTPAPTVEGALGGANAEHMMSLNSSDHSQRALQRDFTTVHGESVATRGIGAVTPDDSNYYTAWSKTLNDDFNNSIVPRALIRGQNPQSLAKEIANDPKKLDALHIKRDEALEHVYRVQTFVNNYAPVGSGIREKMAMAGSDALITPQFLRGIGIEQGKLPIVHGSLIDETINMRSQRVTRGIINSLFKFLGSMPEDSFARHPLFVDLYNKAVQTRFNNAEFLNKRAFTPAEFAELQYNLMKAARGDALRGVKKTLYNVERRSNAAHLLRFVSPFFSAQENAIKTWLRIASTNPIVVSRAATIWTAPNRLGIATDQNGDKVPVSRAYSPTDTMWFELPKGISKFLHTEALNQIGISKRSIDVIFQGNPLGISVGPLTAVPASYVMKKVPAMADVLSFAFPYGPDTSVEQFMPTWGRKLLERSKGVNSAEYARAYQLIWITEQHKARDEQRPYLTEKQIDAKTKAYYSMRSVANLILPFAPQFKSPYRFYMDQWRVYQDKHGIEADSKFLEDFPDFFDFATSLSKSTTSMDSSMSAVGNAKRYKELIGDVAKSNPSLVGLITNGSGGMQYSPTASWWQSETQISSDSPEKFREVGNPRENIRKNEARKGWAEYRKINLTIEESLKRRGLTSIDDSGAEDLKEMKAKLVASISTEYDPVTGLSTGRYSAWYEDFRDNDGLKSAKNVAGLKKIISNEKFLKENGTNPTWKSVVYYLELRERLARVLALRPSSSIDHQDNRDIKGQLEYYVRQLRGDDIAFADIYDRFLSQDRIYDKNLGIGG